MTTEAGRTSSARIDVGSDTDTDYRQFRQGQARRVRRRKLGRAVAGFAAAVVIWQLVSTAYDLELVLPPPSTVLTDLYRMLTLQIDPWPYQGGNIYQNAGASLLRALVGFLVAVLVAVPCGLVVGKVQWVRETLSPVLGALYPIPGSAWIPLAFLWFGLSNFSVVFVVFISAFFPAYYNTEAGVRAINPLLIDAGYCFGARRLGMMRRVVLPAALPFIVSGLRIGIGGAWRVLVIAELLVGSSGLGYMLSQAQYNFRSDDLICVMILIGVVGFLTEKLFVDTLERRTTALWERAPSHLR